MILSPGSMFMAEPELLLYDELRDLQTYLAVLRAISNGHHTLSDISNACLIGSTDLTFYLTRLQELRLVERRLPATLTIAQQRRSKKGRYHLSDPFFRFYFRFLLPHQKSLKQIEETASHIQNELRSFVGLAFERLAQQWIVQQAHAWYAASSLAITCSSLGVAISASTRSRARQVHQLLPDFLGSLVAWRDRILLVEWSLLLECGLIN